MTKRSISLLFLTFSYPAAMSAGEFSSTAIGEWLSWKPTLCEKPAKLYFHITDIDAYNAAVEEYNKHLIRMRTYRSCINEEAQKDARTVAESISSGLEWANEQIKQELDAAQSNLESAKRSFQ